MQVASTLGCCYGAVSHGYACPASEDAKTPNTFLSYPPTNTNHSACWWAGKTGRAVSVEQLTPSEPTLDVAAAHRSPHTFELVDPTNAKIDKRGLPENIEARVRGRQHHTNSGSEQLYVNNPLSTDPVAVAAEIDPDRLHNSRDPNLAIISEKPWHRMFIYLKAQGLSDKELAERSGRSQPWISNLCRQPWFRLRLVQELKEAGQDAIKNVLKASALDSVFTLIDIRDDGQAPKAVRRACADSLLDRYLGRATQRVETDDNRTPSSPEIAAVEKELAEVNRQLGDTNNGKIEGQSTENQ